VQYLLPGSQRKGKREWAVDPTIGSLDDMLPLHQWLALATSDSADHAAAGERETAGIDSEWLFAASTQAVLIVDAEAGSILRANPAAALLLNLTSAALAGAAFLSIFDDASAAALWRDISEANSSGSAPASIVRERQAGRSLSVQLSLVRSAPQNYLLVRLEFGRSVAARAPKSNPESAVMAAIDAAPLGFLIAAADFHVEYANQAFVRMIKAHSQAAVRGSSILRWLRFEAADLSQLSARLSQRQSAHMLTTVLHPNFGLPQRVEVCAVPVPDGLNTQWGFTLRHLPRLN
jgi:PAS domain-containing protein